MLSLVFRTRQKMRSEEMKRFRIDSMVFFYSAGDTWYGGRIS